MDSPPSNPAQLPAARTLCCSRTMTGESAIAERDNDHGNVQQKQANNEQPKAEKEPREVKLDDAEKELEEARQDVMRSVSRLANACAQVELAKLTKTPSEESWLQRVLDLIGWDEMPPFYPYPEGKISLATDGKETSKNNGGNQKVNLNTAERIFVVLNEPYKSILGTIIGSIIVSVILLNTVVSLVITIPQFRSATITSCPGEEACHNDPVLCPGFTVCEPGEDPTLSKIDTVCVIIFTLDYGLRIILSWFVQAANQVSLLSDVESEEKKLQAKNYRIQKRKSRAGKRDVPDTSEDSIVKYSPWRPIQYFFQVNNLIDLLSIVPAYIVLASSNGLSLSFIRALRLLRVIRAFQLGGGGVLHVMIRTLIDSIEPLSLLFGCVSIIILIFGSIAFNLEAGTFRWACDWDSSNGYDNSGSWPDKSCRGGYVRPNLADNTLEQSPFHSSFAGMYWSAITMTTVGYGDIYPTTIGGRILATVCALSGLILMALPINILGTNFSNEYSRYKELEKRKKEDRFSTETEWIENISLPPNLDSVRHEVKKLVREAWNSSSLKHEVRKIVREESNSNSLTK